MKTDIAQFIPFYHENFEFKKSLIKAARDQDKSNISGMLSATLIYANTVDYLAFHILENLRTIVYLTTYTELNATIFYAGSNERKDEPLGNIVEKLKNYDFPDKKDMIQDLSDFNELRKKYVHNFLKIDSSNSLELDKADKELLEIIKISERIITRYDKIVQGIRDSWSAYTDRLNRRLGLTAPPAINPDIIPETNPPVNEKRDKPKKVRKK
ncbi:MAG: hypothetical protein M1372_00740 [Patescibacteria group bacterium]|nr:hypothetical protein [Patescibacteria group bacterium]